MNFSLELSHRRFIDETGLFILGDLGNIVFTSFASLIAKRTVVIRVNH